VCTISESVGDAVYVAGDLIGGLYYVRTVDIDSSTTEKSIAFGVIKSKSGDTSCMVLLQGVLTGIYSSLTPGKRLFVDLSGGVVDSPPAKPGSGYRVVQSIGYALASSVVMIRPEEPVRMKA
jgi:hypothetical protein